MVGNILYTQTYIRFNLYKTYCKYVLVYILNYNKMTSCMLSSILNYMLTILDVNDLWNTLTDIIQPQIALTGKKT